MAKKSSTFICNNCGAQSSAWAGKCSNCGEWNSLEEVVAQDSSHLSRNIKTSTIDDVSSVTEPRVQINLGDLDDVLGGGLVPGSVILLAGEPGIGKSTLLTQIANNLSNGKTKVCYISGEESTHQIGLRAKRLNANSSYMSLASSNSVEEIISVFNKKQFDVVIVDSIQTIATSKLTSSSGSVTQITYCSNVLIQAAKQSNVCLIIVGHVTKDGTIAGPKILEHMVDCVLQLEGDRYGGFKVLRGQKNRYGSTHEIAIFEMQDIGLVPVGNPSSALLEERQVIDGSIVLATMEGSRPILVEVQALVNKSVFGYPKRTASGIDINRLNVLVAMLERRTKLQLYDKDIYINIIGGMKIQEPAADLAVCMAIASATKGYVLKKNSVVFGEVGLSGEVRHVPFVEKRIDEAMKLGFDGAIGPKNIRSRTIKNLYAVKTIKEALNLYLVK